MGPESSKAIKNVLLIGGHGMLGRPVARRLAQEGFSLRAMARNPDKARALLPEQTEVVAGDLKNIDQIKRATDGMHAVYLNLETYNTKAPFRAELDGTKNVIAALATQKDILIAKLSALDVKPAPDWPNAQQKYEAEEAIKASGQAYLLFRPTWLMESLPLFYRGKRLALPGNPPYPLYWVAGDDLGHAVATALANTERHNQTYNIQGPEPLTLRQAAERFIAAYQPAAKVRALPLWPFKILALFNPGLREFMHLMKYTYNNKEEFISQQTWDELGAPKLKIEDYIGYIKQTGDWPQKKFS